MAGVIGQSKTNPVKIWLRGYLEEKARMESLMHVIDDLNEAAQRATARITATRLSGTGSHGGFENTVIKKIDAERKLDEIVEHIHETLLAREAMISRLTDPLQRHVLTLRYLEGKKWEQVAIDVHYEKTQVYEMHGKALKQIGAWMHEAKGQDCCDTAAKTPRKGAE
jgi:DNA-directed RNA polymerase specialized sigma24 family protein